MDKYTGMMLDNRYELLEPIGYGGMAVVYKARCHRLNRLVAVKILKEEYSRDADFKRRFETESRAVAMLSHPNIVSVYDVNRSDGLEYIVMELIDGMTLKDYMQKRGRLGWRETLHFSTLIAKALEHAHSRGVIHRDIKPHNIMVLRDGSVKVADFGIARFTSSQHTLTQEALGSVHYISPEQARGSQLDARTDIYSLGVVMYEMLTGMLPYDGESPVAVAIAHINSKPVMPHELCDDIPVGLEHIAMKAMTADLSKRYASATDMLVDLEEFRKNPDIDFGAPKKEIIKTINLPVKTQPQQAAKPRERSSQPSQTGKPRKKNTAKAAARPAKKASRAPLIAGIACILIFVLGVMYFLYSYFIKGLISENAKVVVPKFVGAAYENLDQEDYPGLNILLEATVSSDEYSAGLVIDQEPQAGSEVKVGTTVRLTVSAGEATDIMPEVMNMQQQLALMTLNALKVKVNIKVSNEYSDYVEGYVIRSEPVSGEALRAGDDVTLVVSLGPQETMVLVPNVTGVTREEAERTLEESGLQVGEVNSFEYDMEPGMVYYQSCNVGDSVPQGTKVNLYVSLGPADEDETEPEPEPEDSNPLEIAGQTSPEPSPEPVPEPKPETSDTPASSIRSIVIVLPTDQETVKVTVTLDDVVVYENTVDCSEEKLWVDLEGSGQQFLKVYLDDVLKHEDVVLFE